MKVGVCIKYFHENYGGMLQAYATTKMLEKLDVEYELIRYVKKRTFIEKIRSIPRIFNRILLNDKIEALKKKLGKRKCPALSANDKVRLKAFDRFKKENFKNLSKEYVGYKKLQEGAFSYDAVITGSDQLWSPAGLPTNFYNLMFVDDKIKKISYASSFGVGNIPWYQRRRTKQFLDRIDYISMREKRGSEIVEKLTGKKVPTVMDPVFMLTREEWDGSIKKENLVAENYVFAYFLGNNIEARKTVQKYAEEKGLKIVTLRHMDQYVEYDENFGDYAPYDVGPDGFLNLIRNAEFVFTDSFHGTCFSIINRKKFMVFNRYSENSKVSKNSRIDTLCEMFNVTDRRYSGSYEINENEINYQRIEGLLIKYREMSYDYLKEALL